MPPAPVRQVRQVPALRVTSFEVPRPAFPLIKPKTKPKLRTLYTVRPRDTSLPSDRSRPSNLRSTTRYFAAPPPAGDLCCTTIANAFDSQGCCCPHHTSRCTLARGRLALAGHERIERCAAAWARGREAERCSPLTGWRSRAARESRHTCQGVGWNAGRQHPRSNPMHRCPGRPRTRAPDAFLSRGCC
jgi:hypothetical protein